MRSAARCFSDVNKGDHFVYCGQSREDHTILTLFGIAPMHLIQEIYSRRILTDNEMCPGMLTTIIHDYVEDNLNISV